MMLAEAHFSFYILYFKAQQQRLAENDYIPNNEFDKTVLYEYYLYGTSTVNERIENF
jgi:hypothetical protein